MTGSVMIVCLLFLYFVSSDARPQTEHGRLVLLNDVTLDHGLRHIDGGLPGQLQFTLVHEELGPIALQLVENRRLNADAPIYDVMTFGSNKQKLVKRNNSPVMNARFYQDKRSHGAFSVECEVSSVGPCARLVTGNFHVNGRSFDINPTEQHQRSLDAREMTGIPHVLRERYAHELPKRTINDYKYPPGVDRRNTFADTDNTQDRRDSVLEELKKILSASQMRTVERRIKRTVDTKDKRQRGSPLYAVEILVTIDPILWRKYFEKTEQNTEQRLRRRFSHVMNGMSLRYETIEDKDLDIYLTISGFLFYKNIDESNPLPPNLSVVNGDYADGGVYLDEIVRWGKRTTFKKEPDHVMVFTGYTLYDGSYTNSGVVGLSYVGEACTSYGVSINEDQDYFVTISVAAHELGHNLGAYHDGDRANGNTCDPDDSFLMAPYVTSFRAGEQYKVNPWRFSSCSVREIKGYLKQMETTGQNCLTDPGDYYNKDEYDSHLTSLPGELHSADKQCKLIHGHNAKSCTSTTDENICRVMRCGDTRCTQIYGYFAAAYGTQCGASAGNKWCYEGRCQIKHETEKPGIPKPTVQNPTPGKPKSTKQPNTPGQTNGAGTEPLNPDSNWWLSSTWSPSSTWSWSPSSTWSWSSMWSPMWSPSEIYPDKRVASGESSTDSQFIVSTNSSSSVSSSSSRVPQSTSDSSSPSSPSSATWSFSTMFSTWPWEKSTDESNTESSTPASSSSSSSSSSSTTWSSSSMLNTWHWETTTDEITTPSLSLPESPSAIPSTESPVVCLDNPQFHCNATVWNFHSREQFCENYGDRCCAYCEEAYDGDDRCQNDPSC